MVEYITHSRDVVTEAIYPEAVTMVGTGQRGKWAGMGSCGEDWTGALTWVLLSVFSESLPDAATFIKPHWSRV